MEGLNVSEAAGRTGWSPRMLRYLEKVGLIVPPRTAAGYRKYGLRELNELRTLTELRTRFHLQFSDLVFAARLRREPELRREVDSWLAGRDDLARRSGRGGDGLAVVASSHWVEWEQRKHERLLEVA